MNTVTLHIPSDVARAKLKAVRTAMHRKADEKYQELEAVYEAVANGLTIVNVDETFRTCETFKSGLPRFAIARADRREVDVQRWRRSMVMKTCARMHPSSNSMNMMVQFRGMPEVEPADGDYFPIEGTSPVPGIPPEVRTRVGSIDLRHHFILWEVESWGPTPDRDPMLLRPLGSGYYALVDHWELTELEARVLSQ